MEEKRTTQQIWPADSPNLGLELDALEADGYVPDWMQGKPLNEEERGAGVDDARVWLDSYAAAQHARLRCTRQSARRERWHTRGRAWLALAGVVTPPDYQA